MNYLLGQDKFFCQFFSRIIYNSNFSHPTKDYTAFLPFSINPPQLKYSTIACFIRESHFHFWAHILICGIPEAIVLRSHCQFAKDHGIFTFRALLQIFTHHSVLCQYLIGQWAARPFGLKKGNQRAIKMNFSEEISKNDWPLASKINFICSAPICIMGIKICHSVIVSTWLGFQRIHLHNRGEEFLQIWQWMDSHHFTNCVRIVLLQ